MVLRTGRVVAHLVLTSRAATEAKRNGDVGGLVTGLLSEVLKLNMEALLPSHMRPGPNDLCRGLSPANMSSIAF